MIEHVAVYLQANGAGTISEDLIKGNMPETPVDCTCLFDTGGQPPEQEINIDYPTVSIISRSKKYEVGKAKAQQIYDLLNRKLALDMDGVHVFYCRAVASVQCMGLDEKNRWQFVVNYLFKIRLAD